MGIAPGLDCKRQTLLGCSFHQKETLVNEEVPMTDASHRLHPDELQSDLDLLVEMAHEPKQDAESIRRHAESLKAKLDKFVHEHASSSGGGSAT